MRGAGRSERLEMSQIPCGDLSEVNFRGPASLRRGSLGSFPARTLQLSEIAGPAAEACAERSLAQGVRPGTPGELHQAMARHVIGNVSVLHALSVIGFNHLKRTGQVLSVISAQQALQEAAELDLGRPDGVAFLHAVTAVVRRYFLNKRRDNPLRDALDLLIEHGEREGVLRSSGAGRVSVDRVLESLIGVARDQNRELEENPLDKTNVLLMGGTGTGKTLIAKTLAGLLHVPFLELDATTFSETGYEGDSVRDAICRGLLSEAQGDPVLAGRGIVFIDELDKLRLERGHGRDVSGAGVQQDLLKPIEACVDPETRINTARVLFIGAGAFSGLEECVLKRLNPQPLGFMAEKAPVRPACGDSLKQVEAVDLVRFGMISELAGRFSRRLVTDEVTQASLRRMLVDSASSPLFSHYRMLELDGIQVEVAEGALDAIAAAAIRRQEGGRSLKSLCDIVFEELHFSAPELCHQGVLVRVSREYVLKCLEGAGA